MNKGLNLQKEQDELRGDEWKFGAISQPSLFSIVSELREQYLPVGELQNIGDEKFDCVTRAAVNKLEVEFTYAYQNNLIIPENKKWLEDNSYVVNQKVTFSDAFIGILSGTTREGNSLKAPVHAIYKQGLIPKLQLPQLEKFDEHYNIKRITPAMYKLGQDFLERFTLNYEQVDTINLEKAIEKDMLSIAVNGGGTVVNGEYQRTEEPFSHCVVAFKLPRTYIFDNYLDSSDGDFIKKYAKDYAIYPYGYRIYVTSQKLPSNTSVSVIIGQILKTIGQILGLIQKEIPVEKPVEPKPQEVYNEIKESLKPNMIEKWAKAIDRWEGNTFGNNPGNLKYSTLIASFGAKKGKAGSDGGYFAVFDTYEQGFKALCSFLELGCKNQLKSYKNARTLGSFMKIYAGNPPQGYINGIAKDLGVPLDVNISTFI